MFTGYNDAVTYPLLMLKRQTKRNERRDPVSGQLISGDIAKPALLSIRLPSDLDSKMRSLAGDRVADWVREAIAEKIERANS